jgi:hypothetical protein
MAPLAARAQPLPRREPPPHAAVDLGRSTEAVLAERRAGMALVYIAPLFLLGSGIGAIVGLVTEHPICISTFGPPRTCEGGDPSLAVGLSLGSLALSIALWAVGLHLQADAGARARALLGGFALRPTAGPGDAGLGIELAL